ncbi:helix-turn-helix transcriptional regulator [Kribbella albertanoniae]|uniref:XRE family transcriptional regulator n=1 Tax=Kribbella albertanoniae TaxID=1266829 RepID=A0A4R4P5T5_9ACTN|nr:helix-turn-helix transcriptional regulator [Kribbella albertanoniae]TDC16077.1 XRE family transcriptional regulator [Kribbella albertanoniae]
MDKPELAAFLRSRRERIGPAEAGLPAGRRRRTPGLRREEVAQLAFISTEYYTRLEQARAPHPSYEVLAGIARALRLSDAERNYLYRLADVPVTPPGPSRVVRQSILDLIERLPTTVAIVLSATYEVIAWNHLAAALLEDFSQRSRQDRNLLRREFLGPRSAGGRVFGASDGDQFARNATNYLRATAARYPDDPEVQGLIADLLVGSPRFAELWQAHEVAAEPALCKTFDHPLVGLISVNCDALAIPDRDQQLILYTAPPGSPSEEALKLLAVIGTQELIQ